jgi:integrase
MVAPTPVVDLVEETITAWLEKKRQISGSARTLDAYRATIDAFRAFARAHAETRGIDDLDLFSTNWQALYLAAQAFLAHSKVPGRQVTASTRNQRRAILSSFYTFANRMTLYPVNPIAMTDRAKGDTPYAAPALESEEVTTRLSQIDPETLGGKRDLAIFALALTTSRRVSEIANLTWRDLRQERGQLVAHWIGKGNKPLQDTISPETHALLDDYRAELERTMQERGQAISANGPVFISLSNNNYGGKLTIQGLEYISSCVLAVSKFHATRHTAAVTLDEQQVSLYDIMRLLGHSNIKTTSDYLERKRVTAPVHGTTLEKQFGIHSRKTTHISRTQGQEES